MDSKVRVEQLVEFFAQIKSGRITGATLQGFLERPQVRTFSLDEYRAMVHGNSCYYNECGGLLADQLGHYDHFAGWFVDGFDNRQWLFTRCRKCGDEISLSHWGVPRYIIKEANTPGEQPAHAQNEFASFRQRLVPLRKKWLFSFQYSKNLLICLYKS